MSSDRILEELERALEKQYFRERLAERDRSDHVALVRREVVLITPRTEVQGIASDRDDDHVLATAVDGEARYVVTGDRGLLRLGSFRSIEIVTARELMETLGAKPPPPP